MDNAHPILDAIADTLDDLGVGLCVFDDADDTLLWNRSFLHLFPEHAGFVHVGEPYSANLRRFYEVRLDPGELPAIERYIEQALARHHAQQRPVAFEHRGRRLWVASLPLPGIGRLRCWRDESVQPRPADKHAPPQDGTALFDRIVDGVMVADVQGRIEWVNLPFVGLYGLERRETAFGLDFQAVYRLAWRNAAPAEASAFEQGLAALAENLRFAGASFEVPLPGRRYSRVTEQRGPDGRRFLGHVDISELRRQQLQLAEAEQRARESEARLREKSALLEITLERLEQGVLMVNTERVVEVCNRRAIELLGLPPELMSSKPRFEQVLAYQWATDEFVHTPQHIQDFVRAGGILDQPQTYDRRRPDGRVIEVQSVPIAGGGVLRTYSDITRRRRDEERIRHMARHDGLTSLANREVFLEHLASATSDAATPPGTIAVHFIDLDGFKQVNDRHGHGVGDKVLTLVATRVRQTARESDLAARLGGDEFAILQHQVEREEAALGLAQRVLQALSRPIEVDGLLIEIGASIGIVLANGGEHPDTLLRQADVAMYAAKAAGRNRVRVHSASG